MPKRQSILIQLLQMMREQRQYWLFPVLLTFCFLIVLTIIVNLSGGAAAPFIYTLF